MELWDVPRQSLEWRSAVEKDEPSGDGDEEDCRRTKIFEELKYYCLYLLELFNSNSTITSADTLSSLFGFLRSCTPVDLQPFFDYTLFPLLLLLDAAVNCRDSEKCVGDDKQHRSVTVNDRWAESVVICLEELLLKCRLSSVDQMVVLMKKLTKAAMLSPTEASEEFREGVIKCFRALLTSLVPCGLKSCACGVRGVPALMEAGEIRCLNLDPPKYGSAPGSCLLEFLQSQGASAAVGHWSSLLLKSAETESARGHRGSAQIRVEALLTLRVLVAKAGKADALAFFLPGVVSQLGKVLLISKKMISGAAGNLEAYGHAIKCLAEYLMIVLDDGANSLIDDSYGLAEYGENSGQSVLNELRNLKSAAKYERNVSVDDQTLVAENVDIPASESAMNNCNKSERDIGSFFVDRTRVWLEKTSKHVNKLLIATFPHLCVHPAKRVRRALLSAITGMLAQCKHTLKDSKPILLECLFVLVFDDSPDISALAQEFLGLAFHDAEDWILNDGAEIFTRVTDNLPKIVLTNDDSLAISNAQKLLAIVYYAGPQFVRDRLKSSVMAARFLDLFAFCLSQNCLYSGSLGRQSAAKSISVSYIPAINELKNSNPIYLDRHTGDDDVSSNTSKPINYQDKILQNQINGNYDLPRMPPWIVDAVNPTFYQVLAGILRLIGSSLTTDLTKESSLSLVIEVPLTCIRKLVSEVRKREYRGESWHAWYSRTGSGQLLRQASTAACVINEIIFGTSKDALKTILRLFESNSDDISLSEAVSDDNPSIWKISEKNFPKSEFIDCVGVILHEYLSSEIWNIPLDGTLVSELREIIPHSHEDSAMLQQVVIEGIGICSLMLGDDFSAMGFLHSSLYLLLEVLVCSNSRVKQASDRVLHVISASTGYSTVGELVLANADYIVDSICRELRHLDVDVRSPSVLASMLSFIGVAQKLLPLLVEPMHYVSLELEILGRHKHPELNYSFLKAVAEILKATKREACLLPSGASSYHEFVKSKVEHYKVPDVSSSVSDTSILESEWENLVLTLNDSKRYRRIVGSITSSCLIAATPLLASSKQNECLVAMDIIEDGIATLSKVEEAYHQETETKEIVQEFLQLHALHQFQDVLNASEDGSDENRLLPAMNKVWPFLVSCLKNQMHLATRRCLEIVPKVVQICGGDFFTRRFHTDGHHFWKLLSSSPFHRNPFSKDDRKPLLLPYRRVPDSSEDVMAETSNIKVQNAALNMIAELARHKRSASALEVVLKKVSGLVVGIACSGVAGLRDASMNALVGLASIDADLIWLLVADVYFSIKKESFPSPPTADFPEVPSIHPPLTSPKLYLYIQYGGQSYGFEIDATSVELAFKKLSDKS